MFCLHLIRLFTIITNNFHHPIYFIIDYFFDLLRIVHGDGRTGFKIFFLKFPHLYYMIKKASTIHTVLLSISRFVYYRINHLNHFDNTTTVSILFAASMMSAVLRLKI